MKTITQIDKQIEELQKERQKIIEKSNDFQVIKTKDKEFRIYVWESKLFKDFPMPEGFDWAENRELIDLYDNNLIELEKYPIYYYTKNISKKNGKTYFLSRLCLGGGLGLGSSGEGLAGSGGDGRVVVSKVVK